MPTATETAAQNARTVTEQSKALADQTVSTAQQVFQASQQAYLTMLEGVFQASNRWFEVSQLVLDQAELASRESKETLNRLASQTHEGQGSVMTLARDSARIVENTWLGVYRNGRNN